ncbi:hypothetical protein ACFVVC_04175 [Pseudarthrobacter sp. NPDC058196]|uniref:hypothetical protein n=1 Tax=Pseudarthrobacter sp. NPDC058196 TaxID=3346376 RepID=UPI0036DCCC2D
MELDEIVEDDEDELAGTYCAVTDSRSIPVLHPHYIGVVLSLGLLDLDAAALKMPGRAG